MVKGKILIVSTNKGKIREISSMLSCMEGLVIETIGPEYKELDIEENGLTFCENALIKAKSYAERYGVAALSDDSGLEVDVLDGRPGVQSARYAGFNASDEDRVNKLLHELKGVQDAYRLARFVCCVCLYDPGTQDAIYSKGVCEGRISQAPRGANGFGYDPIFVVNGTSGRTMAELSMEEKNKLSHRAIALKGLVEKIV